MDIASEKQASDILLLYLGGLASFADYFVLLTGDSERQLEALDKDTEKGLAQEGVRLLHREGSPNSGWMLLDYGDVIIHIFSPTQRAHYSLEQVWAQATPLVKIQ